MSNSEILDDIKTLIASVLEEDKLCLVDASFYLQGGRWILQLLVDKIYGGITLDECARLNERISSLIEREGIIRENYVLEVSSPGIDRSLLTREDFSRCLNRKIRIFFKQCQGGKSEILGVIISVTDTGLNLDLDGQIQLIPFDRIKKAKQVI
jgi:ribosome maturation factor RimP